MGSAGNQNPWAPYDSYKDCSVGICSVYCPQWCFYILPPPPPPDDDPSDDGYGPTFSPLIIAIIGILASAFLLVTYYTVITKYCRRRDRNSRVDLEANEDQWQGGAAAAPPPSSGLDETVIKSITVCKYRKGEGVVEGTECSVCLSEFQDEENLRLLPKCNHAFHLPCIDTWLKSHSNCPLCRSNLASPPPLPPQQNNPPVINNDPQTHTHLVLASGHRDEEGVVSLWDATPKGSSCSSNGENSQSNNGDDDDDDDDDDQEEEDDEGIHKQLRRSVSLGTFSLQQRIDEEDNDQELLSDGRKCKNITSHCGIGRSISTGRLMFSRYEKGFNSKILFRNSELYI